MDKLSNKLRWTPVKSKRQFVAGNFYISVIMRSRIAGGWLLILRCNGTAIVFMPDPKHEWTGDDLSLTWEVLENQAVELIPNVLLRTFTLRASISGGWIVITMLNRMPMGMFIPDPEHSWDGSSLPEAT